MTIASPVAPAEPRLLPLVLKTTVVHTVTYFVMGVLALWLLDYRELHERPELAALMRPITDPMVMAGPLFQPIRGLVFALAIYPIRGSIFHRRHGWLVLWWLLVALGILSTFGAPPGSIEGLIYTKLPPARQLLGLSEVLLQSLLLAFGIVYWVEHPEKRWLARIMVAAFAIVLLLPTLGLVTR
jgi:hypothetical protein